MPEVSGPVDWLPLVATAPDQLPEAVQAVAFAAFQARVAMPPLGTMLGLAVRLIVGSGCEAEVNVTLVVAAALPPAPEQVRV